MSSIVIAGDTSGSVTLQAPAVAGSTVLNLPSTLGNTGTSAFATTDASGNLGLGVTPSAWTTNFGIKAFDISNGCVYGANTDLSLLLNAYFNGTNFIYKTTNASGRYTQGSSGQHQWFTAPSGTAGNTISYTQTMTLDASGRLGIGTTSPFAPLTVQGDSGGNGISIIGRSTGQNESWLQWYQNNGSTLNSGILGDNQGLKFAVGSGQTERMRIDTSGNLGLGVTPQTWSSSFKPAFQFGTMGSLLNGSGYTFLSTNWYQDASGTDKYITTNFATNYYQFNGSHVWRTAASGTAGNNITWTTPMTLDVNGRLGIGTTAPTANLEVFAQAGVSGKSLRVYYNGTYFTEYTEFSIQCFNNSFQVKSGTTGGVQLTNGATSWSAVSDARLKNVTGTYTNALSDIAQIQPVKFTWKDDTENKPQVGVIAQSVLSAVPEAVDLEADTKSGVKVDEQYYSVRYTELIPLMIASIQEQQALITTLTERITALEGV
jgi:hypothetical protein